MYAFLLTEAWGCRDFVLSTRIEQAFDATKDGRKQIHRLIGQNSHEDVVRHLAAECARRLQERFDTEVPTDSFACGFRCWGKSSHGESLHG